MNPIRTLLMIYVSVLKSLKDGKWHTGLTENLSQRIAERNERKVFSTKLCRPLVLIYNEACLSKSNAKRRERYLKTGMGKRYLKNRLKNILEVLTR